MLEKSYVNGPQMGDMWTINNFHLGLKLCEATSQMAGQRERERVRDLLWSSFFLSILYTAFQKYMGSITNATLAGGNPQSPPW